MSDVAFVIVLLISLFNRIFCITECANKMQYVSISTDTAFLPSLCATLFTSSKSVLQCVSGFFPRVVLEMQPMDFHPPQENRYRPFVMLNYQYLLLTTQDFVQGQFSEKAFKNLFSNLLTFHMNCVELLEVLSYLFHLEVSFVQYPTVVLFWLISNGSEILFYYFRMQFSFFMSKICQTFCYIIQIKFYITIHLVKLL